MQTAAVEARLIRDQLIEHLRAAINGLHDEERALLLMLFYKRIQTSEIARVLGIDRATVWRRTKIALGHVRGAMEAKGWNTRRVWQALSE